MHGTPNCQLPIAKSSGSQPSLWEVGRWKLGVFVLLVLYASTAAAHHSFTAEYDRKPLAAGPERWTAMEGGCPIIADGECIGGIGIADGDWATDARIAQQAVEAIGASHGG
jgi:hypothetical protein